MGHLNLFLPNEFFYLNSLDRSISNRKGVMLNCINAMFIWISVFNANSIDPDQMPHFVATDLGLYHLSMSIFRDTRHYGLTYLPYLSKHSNKSVLQPIHVSGILLDKWQTLKTLLRCHILLHFIWVFTICSYLSVPILKVSKVNENKYSIPMLNEFVQTPVFPLKFIVNPKIKIMLPHLTK